ncbi:hypothetical protein BRC81_03965 [Halobacteriales archaeon QS_1_68_20]|nr:MAG: hypothetical protein BRC81_03965 [Halobacteriales archaeon QS_1_68_20]
MAGDVDAFETAAREVNAEVTRTTAGEFDAAMEDVLVDPAVGTPLPYHGVSLPGWVETDPSPSDLAAAATGVTSAGLGVVESGSVVVESTAAGEDPTSLFPERHVAVLAASDLVADVSAAVEHLAAVAGEGRDAVIETGPSATADMGALVYGAHGPRAVHVVVIEDR